MKAYEDEYYKMTFYTNGTFRGYVEIPVKSWASRQILKLTLRAMGIPVEKFERFGGRANFEPATLRALEENEEQLIKLLMARYGQKGIRIVHVEPTDGYVERRHDGIYIHIDLKGTWTR